MSLETDLAIWQEQLTEVRQAITVLLETGEESQADDYKLRRARLEALTQREEYLEKKIRKYSPDGLNQPCIMEIGYAKS